MPDQPPEIRVTKPLPVDAASKRRPSSVLMTLFLICGTLIFLPVVLIVGSIVMGSQRGLEASETITKWCFGVVGAVLAYGFLVGVYHTFLAVTGLDRGTRKDE